MQGEPENKVPTLEVALVGTLAIAVAICVRLWFVMTEIRDALTDPNAMAYIITEGTIKSDSAKAEGMLDSARLGFQDTERILTVFSVCLGLITLALVSRIWRRRTLRPACPASKANGQKKNGR